MKRVFPVLAALFVVSALVYAQGVAGKWTGEQQGRGGAMPITLELKNDGGKLTGTYKAGDAAPIQISDGKAEGMKVSFKVTQNFRGNDVQITYNGEVKGDELTLTREAGGGGGGGRAPQPLVLKRAM